MTDSPTTVFVVERVTTHPGRGQAFVDALQHDYLPLAAERGMSLNRLLVSPPIWDDELVNEVTVIWAVEGTAAWWRMAKLGRADTRAADFWRDQQQNVAARDRSMAAAAADVEVLADV